MSDCTPPPVVQGTLAVFMPSRLIRLCRFERVIPSFSASAATVTCRFIPCLTSTDKATPVPTLES